MPYALCCCFRLLELEPRLHSDLFGRYVHMRLKLTKSDPVVGDTEGEESIPRKLETPDKVDSGARYPGDVFEK